jgi:hypothetical protein
MVLYKTLGAQPFNYTDSIDALPNAVHAFGGPSETDGVNGFISSNGLFQMPGAIDGIVSNQWNQLGGNQTSVSGPNVPFDAQDGNVGGSFVSDAGTFVLAETALDMHCWGENPVVTAKLQLNGQDRFSEREGSYFDVVQPYQHHTRAPDAGINIYSFALRPEEHQPSGTCNMSRIDNATLNLVFGGNADFKATYLAEDSNICIYATNYNVLRIMSGMGGLAYSN